MGAHRWRRGSRGEGPRTANRTLTTRLARARPAGTRPAATRRTLAAVAVATLTGLGGAGVALAAPSDPPPGLQAVRADLPLVGTAPHTATDAAAPRNTTTAPAPPTTAPPTTAPPTTAAASAAPATTAAPTTAPPTTAAATPAARPAGVAGTPCTATARACVDLAARTAWLLDGDQVVRGPVAVQHGGHEYPTPVGTFSVQWKAEQYTSREFGSPMPYSVFFAPGGIAFHEGRQDTPSAGCVKLVHDDAVAWFSYLQVGDEVQIH